MECESPTLNPGIQHGTIIRTYYSSMDARKISLEGLKKNIIKIYNIDKQICFNDSKKNKVFKKWHTLENLLI